MQKSSRYLLIIITAGILAITLVKSVYITLKYGGTDLRCRVVGSRLLTTGHSPYFYKWNPGDGEFLLDPNDEAQRIVNGNVVTPATLALIYPLSQLPYPYIRWIWTFLQVAAAAGILFLLFRTDKLFRGFLTASPIILGLICSEMWFYNIERGQMYIFYTFFLTAIYACYISNSKYNEFASGFIGGLFILFRPFAAIIGLGFLLHGKVKWVYGCISGFITGCLLLVLPFINAWSEYFKAMPEYVKEYSGNPLRIDRLSPKMPVTIEGAGNIKEFRYFTIDNLESGHRLFKGFGFEITKGSSLALYGMIMVVLSFFFLLRRKSISSPVTLSLFAFLAILFGELFTPAPRGGYNVIQWIFPLTLIFIEGRRHWPTLIILATGLLLLHNFPFYFNLQGQLAELIFIALTLYHIYFPGSIKNSQDGISRVG